jgi:hypothetical protein
MNEFVPFPPKPEPKPKPFPRRAEPILPQATSSPETFNRFVVAKVQSLLTGEKTSKIANARWPGDRRLSQVINRAATEPATPANTQALGATMTFDAIRALQAVSAAARIMANPDSLQLVFDRYERIAIPDFIGLDEGPPPFVAPGQPAPVGQLTSQAAGLEPFKLEFIVVVSKEMIFGSNAERLVGDALRTKMAMGLDKALFDAEPANEGRPPGLRSINGNLGASAALENFTAMMRDIGTLTAAAENIAAAAPYFFVARSSRISAMRVMLRPTPPNFVLLPSAAGPALPESVLLCLMPTAFASAVGAPEVEIVEQAAVEMNDAPGSPDVMQGQRVHSMFQSDSVGIKVRIPASWTIRHKAAANWITCVWPSDIGGGGEGMPEAPFDESVYGRHQSAWTPVCEEPAASPANTAYVRASYGAPGGWYPLEQFLTIYAPLISPFFGGTPRAPHPPANDASTQIATTQFVRDNAGSGGGGGIEEVPAAGGVYARLRGGLDGPVEWRDFAALRVATLDGPVFAPGSSALHGIAFGDQTAGFYRSGDAMFWSVAGSVRMQVMSAIAAFFVPLNVPDATGAMDAVNLRTGDARYLRLAAGGPQSMTDTLISARGSGPTNPGLAIGDNASGFYRDADGSLIITALGYPIMGFGVDRSATITGPLTIGGNLYASGSRITGVANPTVADDALNLRTGDARYVTLQNGGIVAGPLQLMQAPFVPNDVVTKGYVDNLRGRPVVYDIPADVVIPASGAWTEIARVPITLPLRTGLVSLIMVSINCNLRGISNVAGIGVRVPAAQEQRVFGFGPNATDDSAGFSVNIYAQPAPGATTVELPIQLNTFSIGGSPVPYTVVGGGPLVPDRSQIVVTDLGPVS